MTLRSINPTTGLLISEREKMDWPHAQAALEQSRQAFLEWKRTAFAQRAAPFKKAAVLLRQKREKYAHLMAVEMGKTIGVGRGEVDKCAWVCEYYAEHAEAYLAPEPIATEAIKTYVAFQPLGVILSIMPWNWPFWQVFRCAAPALMAGNAIVMKHADNVMGCAEAIESVFTDAGFPPGAFTWLPIDIPTTAKVIRCDAIAAVTLTGSPRAGREVASIAGSVLKKTVLELGGSSAMIVLEDADVDRAVDIGFTSRISNNGQSCLALKRFIVVEPLREEFESKMLDRLRAIRMGDPLLEATGLGPIARSDLRDLLHEQVTKSVAMGAKLLLGGTVPPGSGWFYPPTLLADPPKGSPAYEDELFGPAATIISSRDEAETIRIANDTRFGLGAAVITRDAARGERIARTEINAGGCFINDAPHSDPRVPFGGIKESGFGRELGVQGIRELVNAMTIHIK